MTFNKKEREEIIALGEMYGMVDGLEKMQNIIEEKTGEKDLVLENLTKMYNSEDYDEELTRNTVAAYTEKAYKFNGTL